MVVRDDSQAAKRRITRESCGFMGFFMLWEKLISFIKLNLSKRSQRPTVFFSGLAVVVCVVYIQHSMFSRWG